MKKIDYFFDFLSPFSYFSWFSIQEILENDQYDITFRPLVMAKLFNHWGFPGPGEIPPKRKYMLKVCYRQASEQNIPFSPPLPHPFNPLYALRMASKSASKKRQFEVIDAIWKAGWQSSEDIGDPQSLIEILNNNNLCGEKIYEASFSKEAKLEIKTNIKMAIEKEIFGVPTFSVDDEFFWGNDSIRRLKNYLEGKDKWNKESFQKRV